MYITAQYFATTMVIVGLSVIATVLVLQYHHHDPDGCKMPKWVSAIPLLKNPLDNKNMLVILFLMFPI